MTTTTATTATTATDEATRLREANALLSRFAGQAAHDIQEPLRLIHGYLDLLCSHLDGKSKLDAPKLAHEARDTAERMQRLVTSLLEYTRVANAQPHREPVPLGKALGDAMANLRLRLHETGAQVTHGPLPTLRGDEAQLARLFQNLIENSLKYHGPRAPCIHVASARTSDGWVVTVDDNGPGWPKAGRDRLFQPFTRLHDDQTPGAGLGLAAVRAIVERHGGIVRAVDAPAGGARVEITLRDLP